MIAADTNVLVRLLTDDDPEQTERARRLFDSEIVFLPKTVLLEAEWVLRRLYQRERITVLRALEALVALQNVRCEDEPDIIQALAWSHEGLDFADALHLASSRKANGFATFDPSLIERAAATTAGVTASQP